VFAAEAAQVMAHHQPSLAATNPAQFYENRFVVKYTYSFRP
jgi:hypothetical protein